MIRDYDKTIREHYSGVAKQSGLSSTSTMADETVRAMETEAIQGFVEASLARVRAADPARRATIMDVGCGNGYTLSRLAERFPDQDLAGVEQSDDLRALAQSRFEQLPGVRLMAGDIRDPNFAGGVQADVVLCQRVIINLLSLEDQKLALSNILGAARPGGALLFIECFTSALDRLNEARFEFGLEPVPPAHHNLYLPDDFFQDPRLRPLRAQGLAEPNFLSTHYYVTRVLHPVFSPKDKPFKRNSEFVRFFTGALRQNVGDYSPLKLLQFEAARG